MENLFEQEREQRYTRLNRKTTQTEATLLFNEEEIDEERIEMIAVQLNSDSNLTVSFLSFLDREKWVINQLSSNCPSNGVLWQCVPVTGKQLISVKE